MISCRSCNIIKAEVSRRNLLLIAIATVGTTEIIKNFIQKGGKRIWTLITLLVGALMSVVAFYLPEKILYGIIGVSGATVFYDTIYKAFQKMFERIANGTDTADGE